MAKKERKYIKIRGAHEHNLKGIDIHIFNGTKLCIRSSDLVLGTMSSWIEE